MNGQAAYYQGVASTVRSGLVREEQIYEYPSLAK
jgi:hypothetical protein